MKRALLAGSTGLIGKNLLMLLLASDRYDEVLALSRTPIQIDHPKLKNLIIDFDQMDNYQDQLNADDVFCCLGTTIKKVKTKEAFRKVDLTYPYVLAKLAFQKEASQYMLVSALGASPSSSVFYNQVKGEVEEMIGGIGYRTLHIFRPSLLLGKREEDRSGEEAAKTFFKLFGFLVPKKYKAIPAEKVAQAMLYFANQDDAGNYIHESTDLQAF